MSDITSNQAEAYAARHRLRLAERLGFGIHSPVRVVEYESKEDRAAIKAHNSPVFFNRELAVYERLKEAAVSEVMGFHVT